MDLQLAGKRALITGSTSGIGFATARSLATEGAEIILNGRSRSGVAAAVERLLEAVPGARVSGIAADLSSVTGCETLTAACPDVDILVNNMGIFEPKPLTKAAQLSVARGIAETCTSSGVTVNSVLPGPTRTEGVATFFGRLAEEQGVSVEEAERAFFANARPTSIIKRLIDPAEVAAMVTYVCSPLSSATHGAALRVEGGVVRSMV